jgi:hypothetical protein
MKDRLGLHTQKEQFAAMDLARTAYERGLATDDPEEFSGVVGYLTAISELAYMEGADELRKKVTGMLRSLRAKR